MFVSTLRACTCAPAMVAPEGSVILPTNWPCSTWPGAMRVVARKRRVTTTRRDLLHTPRYVDICLPPVVGARSGEGAIRNAEKGTTIDERLSRRGVLACQQADHRTSRESARKQRCY